MRRALFPGLLALALLASSAWLRPLASLAGGDSPELVSLGVWPAAGDVRAAEDPVRLVVILASGWNTSGDGMVSNSWGPMADILTSQGDGEVAIFPFSYAETVRYSTCDTNQAVATSAGMLQAQAAWALALHPDARLMVVGHSLGGVVATYWLARTLPEADVDGALRDRLGQAAVVTLDSPVRGLSWAETDDRLLGGRGAEIVSGNNCSSPIPDELHPDSELVRALADAAPFSRYYNIASTDDRLISAASAVLGEDPARVLRVGAGDGGCSRGLWTGGYLKDPLHPISNTAKCWGESHGAVLENADVLDWVASIAALQMPVASPPTP